MTAENLKKIQYISIAAVALLPVSAFAQTKTLTTLAASIAGYMNQILALLVGFAVVAFVYFIIRYFIQSGKTDRAEAGKYVMWSMVGFFLVVSMWGVVNILISTFDLGTSSPSSWTSLKSLFPN